MPPPRQAHAVVSTHTTRHLAPTLLGLARQTTPPASTIVTCDTDDADLVEAVRRASADLDQRYILITRPHQGESRSSQVRNNGLRALAKLDAAPGSLVLFLDGDCWVEPRAIEKHLALAQRRQTVVGFRVDLTEMQTESFDTAVAAAGKLPAEPTEEQIALLVRRHARYARQNRLRRFRLAKPHKPKLLSAHFSATLAALRTVNGFDEEYVGYGQEDDDLGRRLYRAGFAPALAVAPVLCMHLYHSTRAPEDWGASPNAARFGGKWKVAAERGIEHPAEQPKPVLRVFEGGRPVPWER